MRESQSLWQREQELGDYDHIRGRRPCNETTDARQPMKECASSVWRSICPGEVAERFKNVSGLTRGGAAFCFGVAAEELQLPLLQGHHQHHLCPSQHVARHLLPKP